MKQCWLDFRKVTFYEKYDTLEYRSIPDITVTRLIRILKEVPEYYPRGIRFHTTQDQNLTHRGFIMENHIRRRESPGETTGGSTTGAFECNDRTFGTCKTIMDSTLSRDIQCLMYHWVIRGFLVLLMDICYNCTCYIGLCYKGNMNTIILHVLIPT